jgi:general secretion pathway protein G
MHKSRPHPLHEQSGFTLIEIMVVVVIIGILASLVAPSVMRRIDEANVVKAKQDIRAYETALNLYRMDNFRYPTTDQGLKALVEKPADPNVRNWKEGGYIQSMRKDPWGNEQLPPEPRNAWRIRHLLHSAPMGNPAARATMPTSATGTSSRSSMRAARAANSGFTLLEILVVVVIIGIITTMAMISINVLGRDRQLDEEAARLQAVLLQVRDEAMLEGRDVGLRLDAHGYDFLRYDARYERWQPVMSDLLLRERTLPDGIEARLTLESRVVQLETRTPITPFVPPTPDQATGGLGADMAGGLGAGMDDDEANKGPEPQIVVQASGDLVPFELLLTSSSSDERRTINGTVEGKIDVSNPDAERR